MEDTMRITFVMAGGFSLAGGDRVIAIYAQNLCDRGHKVHVVTRPRKPLTIRERLSYLRRVLAWPPRADSYPSHFDGLSVSRKRISEYRPVVDDDLPDADAVIATWWETAEWVEKLSPAKGRKFYFLQGYEAFGSFPKDRVHATWRLPFQKIVVANWLKRLAEEQFGDRSAILVPNSVDREQFSCPPRGKQDIPTIGMLYHTMPVKGVAAALQAIRIIAMNISNVRLVTFGEEKFLGELPPNIEHTHFSKPDQSEIKNIYSLCDVWLSASTNEGFGLTCLEAMACRCPVVSTRSGGPEDFIRTGENGILVEIGNISALAEATLNILRMPDRIWLAMSDAAVRDATAYSWEQATDRMELALSGEQLGDVRYREKDVNAEPSIAAKSNIGELEADL